MTRGSESSMPESCAAVRPRLVEAFTGSLEADLMETVRSHLATCPECRSSSLEVSADLMPLFDLAASRLGRLLVDGSVDGPCGSGVLSKARRAALFGRIEGRLDGQAEAEDAALAIALAQAVPDGAHFCARARGPWRETGIAGVRVKVLHLDRAGDRRVALLQMDAGRTFPAHRHHGDEECFVLRGDLGIAGTVLRAGDYQRMPSGTAHGEQSTVDGCLVLLIGSNLDAA